VQGAIKTMNNPLSKDTFYRQVAKLSIEEHAQIRQSMVELRALAEDVKISRTEDGLQKLCDGLKDFHRMIQKHMAFEEEDGFLKPVVEMRPTLSAQVEEIRGEHNRVMETLQELIKAFDSPQQSTFWPRDVPDATLHLLVQIGIHEEKENTMVLDVFCDDVGTKD
jgi:iron-sulfur cluster repair protein YtfE (RIC family)